MKHLAVLAFLTVLVSIGLSACDDDSGESSNTTTAPGGGGGVGGMIATAGHGGAGGQASLGDIYIDAALGNDNNPGTFESPIKTIAAGIDMWGEGRELVLMAGVFSAASGEVWGYTLPGGIVIRSNSAGVVLEGTPVVDGMSAQDTGADLRNLTLSGFNNALSAAAGELSLSGVSFDDDEVALALTGTAIATVTDYSTFVDVGTVALASENASLTVTASAISASGAIDVADNAELTMTDVTVADAQSIIISTSSADISVAGCTFSTVGGSHATNFSGSGAVSIRTTTFDQATVGSSVGINVEDAAAGLSLEDVDIQGYDDGVATKTTTVMTNGTIQYCNRGLIAWSTARVDVDSCTFHYNDTGIWLDFAPLKLRNSRVEYGILGVRAEGLPKPDLGVATEDGMNTFRSNSTSSYDGTSVIYNGPTWARGNTWEANTQGSQPNGGYIVGTTIYGPVAGANFIIDSDVPIHF